MDIIQGKEFVTKRGPIYTSVVSYANQMLQKELRNRELELSENDIATITISLTPFTLSRRELSAIAVIMRESGDWDSVDFDIADDGVSELTFHIPIWQGYVQYAMETDKEKYKTISFRLKEKSLAYKLYNSFNKLINKIKTLM